MTLSVKEVADRYGCGVHTVLGWIKSGELKAINAGRKPGLMKPRWRITPEALSAFEALRTPSAPAPVTRRRRKTKTDEVCFYK